MAPSTKGVLASDWPWMSVMSAGILISSRTTLNEVSAKHMYCLFKYSRLLVVLLADSQPSIQPRALARLGISMLCVIWCFDRLGSVEGRTLVAVMASLFWGQTSKQDRKKLKTLTNLHLKGGR